MALGADINSDLSAFGGSGLHSFAASTFDYGFLVLGMDTFLHYLTPGSQHPFILSKNLLGKDVLVSTVSSCHTETTL